FTQNSGTFGGCAVNNRTTNAVGFQGGLMGSGNTRKSSIVLLNQFGDDSATINNNANDFTSNYEATTQGHWLVTRTGASASAFYYAQNSGTATQLATASGSSGSVDNVEFDVLAINDNPTDSFSPDTVAWAFWGAGFNSTQVGQIFTRFHTFSTAKSLG